MKNGIHFLSGLPRSGSTLLGALLKQNPKLHSGMSSPVGGIIGRVQGAMGPRSEFSSVLTDQHRRNILHGVFEGFFKDVHGDKTVIDTNRSWCSKLPLIDALYPDAKVIVCVRDLVWIMDSFERVLRKNALGQSKMFQQKDALTAHTRVSSLASPGGTVGFAWNATQEAFYGEFSDKLIVVDYEALCREPKRVMEIIYARLGLEPFEHDFDNVVYGEGDSFDADLGVPGLHTVGRQVRFSERPTILPPELYERFSGRNFWRRPGGNPRGVEVILPSAPRDGTRRPMAPNPNMNQGGRMAMGRMRPPAGA
ncbi:sulfotransferase family protein [Lichenibacterium dinghuense]|uniref:sulfotransferase family protein n=1 Tax=Lichenibacterium dinghuense TaxID=2895977 RepID=UPI001F309BE4|nr:sulfotransferase [Lichenibacterium sp. 6Y81]